MEVDTVKLLRTRQVRELLGFRHPCTLYRWINTGRIRAVRLPSGQYRIPYSEIAPYLVARRNP